MPYRTRQRSNTDTDNTTSPFPPLPPPKHVIFPPPGLHLSPDDDSSKVFHAIGKAFASVDNCAMTVKDLAESTLRHGLVCSGSAPLNAASQQITSFIRGHQRRCQEQSTKPLIKSYTLSGTSEDDKLTPALYSRAGGTATRRGGAVDTAFRKGTQVWYLTPESGLADPFERMGIQLPGCKKRRRLVRRGSSGDSEEEQRPKIKLKIRLCPLATPSTSTLKAEPSARARCTPPHFVSPPPKDIIVLDSPLSSPASSSCSLPLPPYPIQSHCRYLRDIPLSPYDIPEYASPPPDSEDEEHDFHNSMMAGAEDSEDSEDEFMSPSLKYDADSDVDDNDCRRSRSASWTTSTDPKTPREGERLLTYPPVKIEATDDVWRTDRDVNDILDRWDTSTSSLPLSEGESYDELSPEWHEQWMTTEDVEDLVNLTCSMPIHSDVAFQIKREEDVDESSVLASPQRGKVGRSFSTPLIDRDYELRSTPSPRSESSISGHGDDVEILGPDSVTTEEFDQERLWDTTAPPPLRPKTLSKLHAPPESCATQSTPSLAVASIDGVCVYETVIDGHTLRRRADNSCVHLPGLLSVLTPRSPASKFMHMDGALHVKDGDLKGTWVPLSFAQSLYKGRRVPKDVIWFLQDVSPSKRLSAVSTMKPLSSDSTPKLSYDDISLQDLDHAALLPPITITSSTSSRLQSSSPRLHHTKLHSKAGSKRNSYEFAIKPMWQRDGFTDWKVNTDSELTCIPTPSSILGPLRSMSLSALPQVPSQPIDCPLSPQEEEIFLSLVDVQDPKPSIIDRRSSLILDEEVEEEEEEAEIEESNGVKHCPRRSKRVAAKIIPTRTSERSTVRRSTRIRK